MIGNEARELYGFKLKTLPLRYLNCEELAHLYAYLVNEHGEDHVLCWEVLNEFNTADSYVEQHEHDTVDCDSYDDGYSDGYEEGYAQAMRDVEQTARNVQNTEFDVSSFAEVKAKNESD